MSTFRGSGSVPNTRVKWQEATGTWTEEFGWTCDACELPFYDDDGQSRQKRKLQQHVQHKQRPCTKQAQARATRASTATMGAPKALNPSLQPVNYHVAMLNSDDGWKLTQPVVKALGTRPFVGVRVSESIRPYVGAGMVQGCEEQTESAPTRPMGNR
jgi:hypothetical protein